METELMTEATETNLELTPPDWQMMIQAKIQYLPATYLAHLYELIALMVRPFEPKPVVTIPELEVYAQQFRRTFHLLMKQDLGINFQYYHFGNDWLIMQYTFPPKAEESTKIQAQIIDIEGVMKLNNRTMADLENTDNLNKQILFAETGIYLLKKNAQALWSINEAQTDARDLLGLLIKNLPKDDGYSTTH